MMIKSFFKNRQTPFWLLTFTLLIGLTLPTLIKDGMFMDAILYTSVAHNLSMGIGSFWFPQFSLHNIAGLSSFHEQPPLVFGIQAIFFKLFGDSLYVERFYTFLTLCITAALINMFWKEIYKNDESMRKLGWLPIILWITIPVCFWSYSNNMHENTMGIFTLCAVLLTYKAAKSPNIEITKCIFSGVFVFLATLSKGIPGFFPLALPFLYWIVVSRKDFSKMIKQTSISFVVLFLIYGILFLIPESRESLSTYFFKRVLHRMSEDPTVDNRFFILIRLFTELLPQIGLVILLMVISRMKGINYKFSASFKDFLFLILTGLAASAPLILTMVQKGFYFVPALPYFAIGFSVLISPVISNLLSRIDTTKSTFAMFLVISFILFFFVTTFGFMQKGKTGRNKELLHDVYLLGKIIPTHSTATIPEQMWNQWDLQCYMIRYFNISLETEGTSNYLILDKGLQPDTVFKYKRIDIETLKYNLYEREGKN